MSTHHKTISKFMSLILRHKPGEIGVQMDEQGWVNVAELIDKMNDRGFRVTREIIIQIVATNDKKRFAFNEDQSLIRASQGHSIGVQLNLPEGIPPDLLYHGTATKYLDRILASGIQRQQRRYVHLSTTIETAIAVGSRHGKPVILTVNAKAMFDAGLKFYLSENKVWLTDEVPVKYISQ